MGTIDIKNNRMNDLVNKSTKKTQLRYLFSSFFILSDLVFQVFIILRASLVALTLSQNNKKINNFTDMMWNSTLLICILQGDIGIFSIVAQPRP